MDISLRTESGKFNLRAAALIIKNGHLLLIKHDDFDCLYTVGGGIQEGETSESAVVRELFEETGYRFELERLVYIQERFYLLEKVEHHEITFFYLVKDIDLDIQDGTTTDQNKEHMHWIPIEELENINLVPAFLKKALKNIPGEIIHVVTYE